MATDLQKLKRLLYLADTSLMYMSGNPEQHSLKDFTRTLEVVTEVVKKEEAFFILLTNASKDPLLPRRITLFYVLAYGLSKTEDITVRKNIAEIALFISKSDEEFFTFISLFTKFNKSNTQNKITTSVGKVIQRYFDNKTPLGYATSVGKAKGYHGWKYKDLIKLSHYRSRRDEVNCITCYVLFGMEKLKSMGSEIVPELVTLLEKWEKLRKTEDELEASVLVSELHANFSQVNPKFVKSQEVWSAIIPELPTREVLRLLPKFYRYGLLKANSQVHGKVVEALTSLENIKKSKLHPLEVLIHMKDFEKGGKPLDPKLETYLKSKKEASGDGKEVTEIVRVEPKCPLIMSSIGKCLKLAYPKDPLTLGTKSRIVVALDLTQNSDAVCFKNKNITCLEAQLALTLYYFKTEKTINITAFNNKDVKGLNIDKSAPFAQSLQKLKDNKSDYMLLPAIFDWAISKKKEVDLFIVLLQSVQSLSTAPKEVRANHNGEQLKKALTKYQEKMSSPDTKLVLICLGSHNFYAGPDAAGILGICGFCPEIPKVVEAFSKGRFR